MAQELWIDTRLSDEEIDFLWACISEENKKNISDTLAGNISKSELLKDKDNWFYETVLKKLTEKMFYRENNNYYKYHVEKENPLPEFELGTLWVNYQKKHEFNPLHIHSGLYSFVIFMRIPIHWKEQHALPISANSNIPIASDFAFVWGGGKENGILKENLQLSSEDEGRMLFFPASLNHLVYPFYECEEERITISGNIYFCDPNRPKKQEGQFPAGNVYEQKEDLLQMMKQGVQQVEEELKMMKKSG